MRAKLRFEDGPCNFMYWRHEDRCSRRGGTLRPPVTGGADMPGFQDFKVADLEIPGICSNRLKANHSLDGFFLE